MNRTNNPISKRELLLTKVLLTIDALCMADDLRDTDKLIRTIYRLAHESHGLCSKNCQRGPEWTRLLNKTIKYLKRAKVVDVEQKLKRITNESK